MLCKCFLKLNCLLKCVIRVCNRTLQTTSLLRTCRSPMHLNISEHKQMSRQHRKNAKQLLFSVPHLETDKDFNTEQRENCLLFSHFKTVIFYICVTFFKYEGVEMINRPIAWLLISLSMFAIYNVLSSDRNN